MEIILAIIIFLLAAVALIMSVLQFLEKGVPFNNAYLYASKSERKKMDKKPLYRQSGVVLLMIFFIFLTLGLNLITKKMIFMVAEYILLAVVFVYAIVSTVAIEKSRKNE